MARMIPATGPQNTDSRGEKKIYALLKQGLSDDFTVIHSLPWLASEVRKNYPKYAPTGEIDFLIIHESLGLLTLEIKGGIQRVAEGLFIYAKTGNSSNHLQQMRKNTHGLARALGSDYGLYFRIGYALVVPDSEFGEDVSIPGLNDITVTPQQSLLIDRKDLDATTLASRIHALMAFWKKALDSKALGIDRVERLVEALCPTYDGTPSWGSRVEYDNRTWLRLTEQQASVVHRVMDQNRMIVTGWPGTGKTLIAIEIARRMIAQGRRVLMLTFNSLLVDYLRTQIGSAKRSKVVTWHGFCSEHARSLPDHNESNTNWLEQGCFEDLQAAQAQGLILEFDVLVLDEAQTLRPAWCAWLATQFSGKPITVFCDETQRFAFEKDRISTEDLCKGFGVDKPFTLTISMRSPRNVFDRLQRIRRPSHQMFSPRDVEGDTLQERVVENMDAALKQVITELKAKGIDQADIVVLSTFGRLNRSNSAERYETVPRFRGMEAPVIIIVRAEAMNEIDLFCAYSRATTLCIALFEAESLGCERTPGKFQELVLENADNATLANAAREQGLTSYLLSLHVESALVGLQSVRLSWCEAWKCWFVDKQDDTEAADLWIDYLLTCHEWPVYSWTSSSRRQVIREDPTTNVVQRGPRTETYELNMCETCANLTPHASQIRAKSVCQRCADKLGEKSAPSQEVLEILFNFDAIITSPNPGEIAQIIKDTLPLPLAALGARIYAGAKPKGVPVELKQLPNSSVLHRLATAFIYSRISLKPVGTEIVRDKLAKDTGRYILPEGITAEIWRQAISRCLGQSAKAGFLKKHKDGVYETVSIG